MAFGQASVTTASAAVRTTSGWNPVSSRSAVLGRGDEVAAPQVPIGAGPIRGSGALGCLPQDIHRDQREVVQERANDLGVSRIAHERLQGSHLSCRVVRDG